MATRHSFVPPYVLEHVADSDVPAARVARSTLLLDRGLRSTDRAPRITRAENGLCREISDAGNTENLPGKLVRSEGDAATGDAATDEAYDGLGSVYKYYWEVHHRDALDGEGSPLLGTVHYGQNYANAFFDGERMVFGDGDGQIFLRLTLSLDVVGHELTHGVVDDEANFPYEGQSGALNESCADVFGSMVKQYARQQTAAEADWLIGDEILAPGVHGRALRDMANPGTAYDDPVLGKDPQPAHMRDYVRTDEDNGGVHINSGIPNKAFHDAAVALGGHSWETVAPVWYAALLDPALDTPPDFSAFAGVTVRIASGMADGDRLAAAIRVAWEGVGVTLPQ